MALLLGCGTLLCATVALAIAMSMHLMRSFYIPGGSMEPTLKKGEIMWVNGWAYRDHDPQCGDIAVFLFPGDNKTEYVKRVIGLPGETVEIRSGKVRINGKTLEEHYVKEASASDFGPVTVPAGQYFVMGDNRNHTSDSRIWGFVPRKNFIAAAFKR
jgi:signal peptidase I